MSQRGGSWGSGSWSEEWEDRGWQKWDDGGSQQDDGWKKWEKYQRWEGWQNWSWSKWWPPEQNNFVGDDTGEEPIAAVQQKLQDCLKSLCKVDSFSSRACAPEPIEIRLEKETSKSGKLRAALRLPPHFPVLRQTPWSEWHSSPWKAEHSRGTA